MDKVLIVDDMQPNIELMSTYLQDSGFDVYSAKTGSSAIVKARLLNPSLMILDLIMPDISGFDVCKVLKSDPQTSSMLVLVVTALDSKDSRTRAFELGADDILVKPFDRSTLLSKIKSLFRVRTLSQELEKQYARLREKNEQLEVQLKMARQVQRSLIQEYKIKINGVSLTSKYLPAMDIGGDIYDIVEINNHSIGIFMADVSGHGISAALLISMLKLLFKNTVAKFPKPDLLLERMNTEFCSIFTNSSDSGFYAGAFYAYIDTKEKRITYSNAGHIFPVFLDSVENTVQELALSGVPLGLMDGTTYDCITKNYTDGDMILFYTDGLSDSYYKDSPEDFLFMLKKLLLDMQGDTSPDLILTTILEHFYNTDEFTENDDVSLILCQM